MLSKKIIVWIVVLSLFTGAANIIFTTPGLAEDSDIDDKNVDLNSSEEGVLNSSWPMHRHDRKRTGQSPYPTNKTEDFLEWKFTAGDSISASPVIGNDTIYVGSWDENIYALDEDGNLKWKFKTGDIIISSLVVDDDGVIYFGSVDKKLYALEQNGSLKWTYDTEGHITSSPGIGSDGTVYTSSYNGLFALNQNGTLKWKKDIGRISQSSPSLDKNGNIYVVEKQPGKLYSFSPNGSKQWNYTLDENDVISTPVIDEDGTIYVNAKGEKLYAINPDGSLKWSIRPGHDNNLMAAPSGRSIALSDDGTIYFGSAYNTLYAIHQNGTEKWNLTFDGSIEYSSPSIGKNGILYLGSFDDKVYAVNPDGTFRWNYTTGGNIYSSPAIDEDGTVYIGSNDDNLYAFGGKAPSIEDKTAKSVNTSETLNIIAEITDNREVKNAQVTYWFGDDDSDKSKEKMEPEANDTYVKEIKIPGNSTEELHYKIKAEDGFGNKNESDIKTIVVKDDISPEAKAGKDRKLGLGEETIFNGSESKDNIGIVNYTWTIESEQYFGKTINYSFTSLGDYKVTLKVKDEANNSDLDSVNVTVEDITDPIADASSDKVVDEDSIVIFNGSKSYDNIGITNYTWKIAETERYGEEVQHEFKDPGNYKALLNVSDAAGNYDTDEINVTVKDVTPPEADAGQNRTVDTGTKVEFNGTGSTDNVGIVNYTWIIGDKEYEGAIINNEFTEAGNFTVTLKVKDKAGNEDTDSITVKVKDGIAPIADAGADKTVDEDVEIVLDGSNSTDNDGIEKFRWIIEESIYYGERVNHTFEDPVEYTIELNVTDKQGNWDTDIVNITVRDLTPPNADGGGDRLVKIGTNTTFDGGNSTDNGEIVNYTWIIRNGKNGKKIATLYGKNVNYTFEKRGVKYVTLTVTDSGNNTDEDTFRVGANHRIPSPGIIPFLSVVIGLALVWTFKEN